jgi:Flp pilus assembly protein TadG
MTDLRGRGGTVRFRRDRTGSGLGDQRRQGRGSARTSGQAARGGLKRAIALLSDRRGSVAVIAAFGLLVMMIAGGVGIDYTLAARRQDQINGIADAAALSAVTSTMMQQSSTTAQTQAQNVFMAQIATVGGVTYSASNISVTATDATNGTAITRTAVVTYTASSTNLFAGLLGIPTSTIHGTSTAVSGQAPKTDFYLLLDTSPSMEIAATTDGINTMVANTSSQGGCAFGCHEYDPAADSLGNPYGEDNYALARALGVTLRLDLVNTATQNLMTTAQTTATQNNTTYRAAIYTMDYSVNRLSSLTSNLSSAKSAAANIAPLEVWDNNCLTSSNCNNDEDSYLDSALSTLNGVMPAPGQGTNNRGDTPQEVLMIVSDAVDDELYSGNRTMAPINTLSSYCATIKARGIRIAFLYLTYNPLPTNSFYVDNIASFQPNIATDAQNCASTGLYFQVNTDGDISTALAQLFEKAVQSARLTQ